MTTREAYIDDDILEELRTRDLEVHELRSQLEGRGHRISTEGLYGRLVHLEATDRARVLAGCAVPRQWGIA